MTNLPANVDTAERPRTRATRRPLRAQVADLRARYDALPKRQQWLVLGAMVLDRGSIVPTARPAPGTTVIEVPAAAVPPLPPPRSCPPRAASNPVNHTAPALRHPTRRTAILSQTFKSSGLIRH
jgi:hypothetical protein